MRMETIRNMILVAISLLAISEALDMITLMVGQMGGFVGGILVALVYILCGRKARAGIGYTGWILVPTLLFIVVPFIYRTWRFFTVEGKSLTGRILESTPFLLSFIIPMILLVIVYFKLPNMIRGGEIKPAEDVVHDAR